MRFARVLGAVVFVSSLVVMASVFPTVGRGRKASDHFARRVGGGYASSSDMSFSDSDEDRRLGTRRTYAQVVSGSDTPSTVVAGTKRSRGTGGGPMKFKKLADASGSDADISGSDAEGQGRTGTG